MLATTFEVGSRLEVEEGGVWYPVRVTQVDETRVCIHFEGWSQRYDKWIDKESGNVRILRKQHTMKRRSRATDDEKPSKRPSATLKVGGVFSAGARKSTRKSTEASNSTVTRSNNANAETSTPSTTPAKGNSGQQNASKENASKSSEKPKERLSTRTLREPRDKEAKNAPAPTVTPSTPTPNVPPQVAVAAAPAKGTPPVGWAYEVVTSAQDLVPRKAFTINEDHNDYKCTQDNCNKSFRKEKLLQSHLKHYHNINIEPIDAPPSTPTTPVAAAPSSTPDATSTPNPNENKRRRSNARRSRATTEEQRKPEKTKEVTLDAVMETSSSTDISNVTVIDTVDQSQATTQLQDDSEVNPTESQSAKNRPPPVALPDANVTPATSSTEATPTSVGTPVPRTPLYGRVGQNRFVPIPEPLVLGREKRKVVKTERMVEAESAFIKKQKTEAGQASAEKKEKRRKSHGGEKEDVDEQQDVPALPKPEAPSDDEATISSPKCLAPALESKQVLESLVEKDMVHCPCGVDEESGLMMQCDLCLCWQHGSCFGLENEKHVPERYVCIACQNARRVIQKQTHQVAAYRAMAEGRLPSLVPGTAGHPQRFLNLTKIAETMTNLRKALRGIEVRILRVYQDTNRSLPERRSLLDAAVADAECIQRQMDICERILAAIDRPTNDQGSEALILRSTVKSVLKDLWTVQRLTLFR